MEVVHQLHATALLALGGVAAGHLLELLQSLLGGRLVTLYEPLDYIYRNGTALDIACIRTGILLGLLIHDGLNLIARAVEYDGRKQKLAGSLHLQKLQQM